MWWQTLHLENTANLVDQSLTQLVVDRTWYIQIVRVTIRVFRWFSETDVEVPLIQKWDYNLDAPADKLSFQLHRIINAVTCDSFSKYAQPPILVRSQGLGQ